MLHSTSLNFSLPHFTFTEKHEIVNLLLNDIFWVLLQNVLDNRTKFELEIDSFCDLRSYAGVQLLSGSNSGKPQTGIFSKVETYRDLHHNNASLIIVFTLNS